MEHVDFYLKMKELHPRIFDKANILEFVNPYTGENSYRLFKTDGQTDCNIYQFTGEIDAHRFISSLDESYSYQPFDVILSTNVLHHDDNSICSLLAMYRELRNNGLLLIVAAGKSKPRKTVKEYPFLQKLKTFCQSALFVRGSKIEKEYYQPITSEFIQSVFTSEMFSRSAIRENQKTKNIEFYGIKR